VIRDGVYKGVNYFEAGRPPDRRKRKNGRRRTWQVSKIWDLHHEIKRRILLGQKNTIIAEALGCTPVTVSNVRNSPIIQDQLAIMQGARDANTVDIAREIQEFAPEALKLLKDIVRGEGVGKNASTALRAKEANGFLDRAGHVPIRKEQHVHAHLTPEEIEGIKERAFKDGPIVDVEYKEVG
jgi:hypothetical protein